MGTRLVSLAFIFGLFWFSLGQGQAAALDCHEEISLNITGDVLLDRGVRSAINRVGVEGMMKDLIQLFSSSDYTLINLECPATDIIKPSNKQYVFHADPTLLLSLRDIGVTHVNLANNHTLDQGKEGFIDTISNCAKAGIAPVGVCKGKAGAIDLALIEKNRIKLALFAINMVEVKTPDVKSIGTGPCEASSDAVYATVKDLHQGHPEMHVIVFLHWGKEYSLFPTEDQSTFSRSLIDAGADVVVGSHPHVIQGLEIYHGRPIVYSLGNLLFDQTLPETQKGLIITLVFGKDSIKDITLHQVRQIIGAPHIAGELKLDLSRDKIILPSELFP
jgi:poly-gamma-glutamate capsule biosynthesis protein CapA/YwtB (metallophosphatase superfamily)